MNIDLIILIGTVSLNTLQQQEDFLIMDKAN